MRKNKTIQRAVLFFLAISFLLALVPQKSVKAANAKVVKVGYTEIPNFTEGAEDSSYKSGYAYDYLSEIALYTGWKYEYVYADWPDLVEMLLSGEIDMLAGVPDSFTFQGNVLFPNKPMGGELFNQRIAEDGRSTSLKGKHYYVAVRKDAEDLLEELNLAIEKVETINPYFFDELEKKYFFNQQENTNVSTDIRNWVNKHSLLKVGYLNDYLPYCNTAKDGETEGIITDIVPLILANLKIEDEVTAQYVGFDDYAQMLDALKKGEVDTVFPVVGDKWYSEQNEIFQSEEVISSYMNLVYAGSYSELSDSVIAINRHNQMQESYARVHFPDARILYVDSIEECLDSILRGEATSTIVNGLRSDTYLHASKYESLNSVMLPELSGRCFGVNRGDTMLLELLNAGIFLMEDGYALNATYSYLKSDSDSIIDFAREHFGIVLLIVAIIFVLIITAFIIYVKTNKDKLRSQNEKNLIISAIESMYPFILVHDLSNDRILNIYDHGKITHKPKWRNIDEMVTTLKKYIVDPNKKNEFEAKFTREDLVKAFGRGNRRVVFRAQMDIHSEMHWFQIEAILSQADTGEIQSIMMGSLIDTEIEHTRELEEAKERAEHASQAKTAFLFNMSHDIRTPLNAITGFLNLMEKKQDDAEKREEYIQKINEASAVLLSLINNVLEMARIESGRVEVEETACDIKQFVTSICEIFEPQMKSKHITFTQDIQIHHCSAYVDAFKLREVFLNLISNAMKYTNEGGKVNVRVKEIPSHKSGSAMLWMEVEDNGIGMSEEFLPKVFDEFSREKNTTESKIEGTGLGMPIAKRFVELLGGTISVESELGQGTKFVVRVPYRITEKEHEDVSENLKSEQVNFEGMRLLLAEDNELNAEIARELLEELGFTVDHVENGKECYQRLIHAKEGYYDAILMDIQMPEMDGYQTTREIRALTNPALSTIPIIAMTANAFEEDKRYAFGLGMNGHIAKPIDVAFMKETLAAVLLQ